MRVHVQGVDRQIIKIQIQGLENLGEGPFRSVSEDDNILNDHWPCECTVDSKQQQEWLTSGDFFILDLMKRSKCFWFMLLE
jgi:hypothetical protein